MSRVYADRFLDKRDLVVDELAEEEDGRDDQARNADHGGKREEEKREWTKRSE